jgi:hypothetical protein
MSGSRMLWLKVVKCLSCITSSKLAVEWLHLTQNNFPVRFTNPDIDMHIPDFTPLAPPCAPAGKPAKNICRAL